MNVLSQVERKRSLKLIDILAVKLHRSAEGGVDDAGIESEEVLRNLRGARVLVVEGGNERGWLAGRVELVVNAAHGENGALIFLDIARDLGGEAILQNEPSLNLSLNNGKEFGGARMKVRCVDA